MSRGALVLVVGVVLASACAREPEFPPDEFLQAELGLTERDVVRRIHVSGGPSEVATPAELVIEPGAFVEFATTDWLVHEVIFQVDSLSPEARAFLEDTDQVASPPLLRVDSRFVLDFTNAPLGRYPFVLEGSGESGYGVVIVREKP